LITFNSKSANGFANSADVVATTAMAAVVVAASGAGRYFSTQGISGSGSGCSSTTAVAGGVALGISGVLSSGVSGVGTLGTSAGRVIVIFSGV
tara:strand:+ start:572 stop:850 length:279 start_codon:yes stop_codon:yes gene_type:complete